MGDWMHLASIPAPTQSSRSTAPTRSKEGAVCPSNVSRERSVPVSVGTDRHRESISSDADSGNWAIESKAFLRQWWSCGGSVQSRLTFTPCELTVEAVYRFRGGGSPERGPRGLRTRCPAGIEGPVGAVPGDAGLPWMDSLLSAFSDFPHRSSDSAAPNPSAVPEPMA